MSDDAQDLRKLDQHPPLDLIHSLVHDLDGDGGIGTGALLAGLAAGAPLPGFAVTADFPFAGAAFAFTGLIRFNSSALLSSAVSRSYCACRFIQKFGVVPKYFASLSAVSAVTGVSCRASRSIRVRGTPQAAATA